MDGALKWEKIIDGLLAILQGLFLIVLSAIAMFFVYTPLSLAMIVIFGIIGSLCFLCGIESLRTTKTQSWTLDKIKVDIVASTWHLKKYS